MLSGFHVREALRYFTRAKRLNAVALGTISLALMGLGLSAALQAGIWRAADYLEGKVEVVAYLNNQLAPAELDGFLARIRAYPLVGAVEYRSSDDALREFTGDPSLKRFVDALGTNPLPASVRVSLTRKTPESVRAFAAWLNEQAGVEETAYGGGDADRLLNVLRLARLAAVILTTGLALAAVVIIGNLISLMVFMRREEITIMRLVGATAGFIRGPFLIWGLALGALGGLAASGLLAGLGSLIAAQAWREIGFDLTALLPPDAARWALLGAAALTAAGALLGLIGSLLAVGRRLRE